MSEKILRSYITQKLDPILHPMATKVFMSSPEDHIQFMLTHMQENHGRRPGINTNERMELEFLRKEVAALKQRLRGDNSTDEGEDKDIDGMPASSDDSEDSEGEDVVAELEAMKAKSKGRGPRTSVSAEAFGTWNKKEDFQPPTYEKSPEVAKALKVRLDQAFMFNALNPEEFDVILKAMRHCPKKAGEVVIKEGDDGEELYVVSQGELKCTKVFVSFCVQNPYLIARQRRAHSPEGLPAW